MVVMKILHRAVTVLGLSADKKGRNRSIRRKMLNNKAYTGSLTILVATAALALSSAAFASSSALLHASLQTDVLPQPSSKQTNHVKSESKNTTSMACGNVSVQVLGSGGPELDDGRTSSAYLMG